MVALDLSSKSCCQDVLLNTKILRGTLDLNLKKIWQKNWGTFKSYSLGGTFEPNPKNDS